MKDNLMKRCPLRLKEFPETPCPLAVQKIKAIKYKEEHSKKGCQWYILHPMSCFCFFKYMELYGKNKEHIEEDIASMLLISIEEVNDTLDECKEVLIEETELKDFLFKN